MHTVSTPLQILYWRKALCWTRHRSFVLAALLLTLLPVLALVLVNTAESANIELAWMLSAFLLMLTCLPLYLCCSPQAAEWNEPTDLFCQWQRQRQGQWCRWQQDGDQSGHTSVPHGTHQCPSVLYIIVLYTIVFLQTSTVGKKGLKPWNHYVVWCTWLNKVSKRKDLIV